MHSIAWFIDTVPVAQVVLQIVDGSGEMGQAVRELQLPPGFATRVPMGSDCIGLYAQYQEMLLTTTKQLNSVAKSTDFGDVESKYLQ